MSRTLRTTGKSHPGNRLDSPGAILPFLLLALQLLGTIPGTPGRRSVDRRIHSGIVSRRGKGGLAEREKQV